MPIQLPQKSRFGGVLTPKLYFFIIAIPKRHFLAQKPAFWSFIGRDRSYGVVWKRGEEYKKERAESKPKFAIFADPFPLSQINQILHAGSYFGYLSWFWVSLRSIEKCGSCAWGSNFWPSHWLGTSLIQQLIAAAQAVTLSSNAVMRFCSMNTFENEWLPVDAIPTLLTIPYLI